MLIKDSKKARDTELLVRFTEWYCRSHHQNAKREPLVSTGTQAGIYGQRIPLLCADCAEYARYAEQRTELCRHDPKPFCSACPIKCYKPSMAAYSRQVMRYAGPRALFSRYWRQALSHLINGRRGGRRAPATPPADYPQAENSNND